MKFIENKKNRLVYMTAPHFSRCVRHSFTTRYGGVSDGIFASLNLGVARGDLRENVFKNYQIICSELGISVQKLVFSSQVHSDTVLKVTSRDSRGDIFAPLKYNADALITNEPALPLIVFSADCIIILLYCEKPAAIAAVHAGWKGTALNIIGKTVLALQNEFGCHPGDIKAAIGAGIGFCCYETGSDVPGAMSALTEINLQTHVERRNGKIFVDLKGINRALLMSAGVLGPNIAVSAECTMCSGDKYWSHRVSGTKRGLQAGIIQFELPREEAKQEPYA